MLALRKQKANSFFCFHEKSLCYTCCVASKKDSTGIRIERTTLKELDDLAASAPYISKTSIADQLLREAIDWAKGLTTDTPPLIKHFRNLARPGEDFVVLDEDRIRAIIREESSPAPPPTQPLKPIRYKPKHPRKPPEDPPSDTPPLR